MSSSQLNWSVIEKLIGTSSEFVDFIAHISQLMDRYGRCIGLHYKEISQQIGVSKQTFYNHLKKGEELNIFSVDWDNLTTKDKDWDIKFNDNGYKLTKGDEEKARYLNTNIELLYIDTFKDLKLNNKLLVLNLLGIKEIRSKKSKKLKFGTLMKYANIKNIYLLKEYLSAIKVFFNIELLEDGAVIELLCKYKYGTKTAATRIHAYHFIKAYCRRMKSYYNDNEINQTITLYCKFAQNWAALLLQELLLCLKRNRYLCAAYIEDHIIAKMKELKDSRSKVVGE